MTVIAALINAEPAAGRQPVSRRLRPDVDVAHDHRAILLLLPLLSNEEIPRRKRRRRKRKEERFELEITTRWKIGDAIRRRADESWREVEAAFLSFSPFISKFYLRRNK